MHLNQNNLNSNPICDLPLNVNFSTIFGLFNELAILVAVHSHGIFCTQLNTYIMWIAYDNLVAECYKHVTCVGFLRLILEQFFQEWFQINSIFNFFLTH